MDFSELFEKARAAGLAAGNGSSPNPMVIYNARNPAENYYVADGACGFAWVVVRPGNSPFANWLKKNGKASKHYAGGVSVWISDHGQSVGRKEAHAIAFAKVLQDAGIKAYAGSRLD